MKSWNVPELIVVIAVSFTCVGCMGAIRFIRVGTMTEARAAASSTLTEMRLAGGASRTARMGIVAEDLAMFSRATAQVRGGRLLSADQVAFNSALGKIRLHHVRGGNPQLFIKGAQEPFAEVLPSQGMVRLFNNHTFTLQRNIYSITKNGVSLRSSPSTTTGNVVTTLHEGEMAIKLFESQGWYHVRVIQNSAEISGYVLGSSLAPLFLLPLASEDEEYLDVTPYSVIAGETKNRWDYYWSSIEVVEMTAKDAIDLLYEVFGNRDYNRRVSFGTQDWDESVRKFVRMDYNGIPILNMSHYQSKDLKILGFTQAGELLQFVEHKEEWVKITRPGDWGPKNFGDWYQVKTLNGDYGWIPLAPYGLNYSFGELVQKCEPSSIVLVSNSRNKYDVYFDGNHIGIVNGNSVYTIPVTRPGNYKVRVLQKGGYLIYPTDRTFGVTISCGDTKTIHFP